jgi:RP/EB family microtubule-associated protein
MCIIIYCQKDNLEFCQWLKAFFDQSGAHRDEYDAAAVRAKGKGGKKYNGSMLTRGGPSKPKRSTYPVKSRPPARQQRPAVETKTPLQASENQSRPINSNKLSKGATNMKSAADTQLVNKNAELESKVSALETFVCDIEKERDFYFGKLRSIELFMQIQHDQNWEGCERDDLVDNLFKVLYATADDDVYVDDEGKIAPVVSENAEEHVEVLESAIIAE